MKGQVGFIAVLLFVLFLLPTSLMLLPSPVLAENDLQEQIDQMPEHGVLELKDQTYEGNIVIDKPMILKGVDETVIRGDQTGNVITIEASEVRLENLHVEGSSMDRSAEEEYAAIKVHDDDIELVQITISDSYHGIYLSQAHSNVIREVEVVGEADQDPAMKGNGIHVYYSNDNTIEHSTLLGMRDGIFFEYANGNVVSGNDMSEARYGMHYMYSEDNQFYENTFTNNVGGAAIMHSRGIVLEENKFSFNQGTRSFGLLVQTSSDIHVEENDFFQNQRGLLVDQARYNQVENNEFYFNDIGIEFMSFSSNQIMTDNRFFRNVSAVIDAGGSENNEWSEKGRGNDWGRDVPLLDLDQTGIGDFAVEYQSSLHQLVQENELVYLFWNSPAIMIYEKLNEIVHADQVMLVDEYPLTESAAEGFRLYVLLLAVFAVILVWSVRKRRQQP